MDHCFLIIGCGSIGKRHLKNLQFLQAGKLIAYDENPARRKEVEKLLGVQAVDNLEKGWELSPTVAVIATPTSLHLPMALKAAQRNCHLFIEKPLSDRKDDKFEQLLQIVKAKNLITLVGCNMRFHPGLIKVKELIDQKVVGPILSARVEFGQYLPDWHPSEDYRQSYSAKTALGGGIILDAIHEIDYLRWLVGQEVKSLFCLANKLSSLEIETEDTAAILIRFHDGTIGELHLDYVQRAYKRSCCIIGEKGTIFWDFAQGKVSWYSSEIKEWLYFPQPIGWTFNNVYIDEMRHFLKCLTGEEKTTLNLFEAKKVLEVALAAKTSATTGKPVSLSLP